jgi:hypothetical protein
MMHDYCAERGWCGSVVNGEASNVRDFIPSQGLVSADQFVTWLLKAEGENQTAIHHRRKELVDVFIKHMGSYKVDAALLK